MGVSLEKILCECGCGNVVGLNKRGKQNRFIKGHQVHLMIKLNTGRVVTPEIRRKLSLANIGKHNITEETREKLRISHMGKRNSDEAIQKQREKMLGHVFPKSRNKKISEVLTGRPLSEEHKKAVSVGMKKRWKDEDYAYKQQKRIQKKPNKQEILFLSILNDVFPDEYEYVGRGDVLFDGKSPDYINKSKKLIIEYFGFFIHYDKVKIYGKENYESKRINVFSKFGYRTLIIWKEDLFGNRKELIKKIKKFHKEGTCV